MPIPDFFRYLPQLASTEPIDPPEWLLRLLQRGKKPQELPAVQAQPRAAQPNPARVLRERGILPQQAATDTAWARRMYDAVVPVSYGGQQYTSNPGVFESRGARVFNALLGRANSPRAEAAHPEREDAWRMYLGLPQENNTFSVARYKPTRSSDTTAIYYSYPGLEAGLSIPDAQKIDGTPFNEGFRMILDNVEHYRGRWASSSRGSEVMGNFTWSRGVDDRGHYLAYYDKWDLDPSDSLGGGLTGRIGDWLADQTGKPYEIYGRIYYDPQTGIPLPNQ